MEIYKSFGWLSIVVIWTGLLYMIKKWPGNKTMSFSAHAASTRTGIVYYWLVFTAHLVLFYLFVSKWFVPTLQLPHVFTIITLVAVLGEFIALCIPTTGGLKTKLHDLSSYVMLILLVPLSLLIFLSPHVSLIARTAALLSVCYMVIVWYLFAVAKTAKKHFLLYQTSYAMSFQLAVLLAVYVK